MGALIGLLVSACGGVTAETPLTLKLGLDRAHTTSSLAAHKFCHKEDGGTQPNPETYPRCDRAGAEWGEAWVSARFEKDLLIELKRYERFSDEGRAVERWNQLVGDRMKLHPDAADAQAELQARSLEPGTRSMKAWRLDAQTVVGVYLLTPTAPENASILEAIVTLPKQASDIEVVQ
jgi:hypothetical protein